MHDVTIFSTLRLLFRSTCLNVVLLLKWPEEKMMIVKVASGDYHDLHEIIELFKMYCSSGQFVCRDIFDGEMESGNNLVIHYLSMHAKSMGWVE